MSEQWYQLTHKETGNVERVCSLEHYVRDDYVILELSGEPGEFDCHDGDGEFYRDRTLQLDALHEKAASQHGRGGLLKRIRALEKLNRAQGTLIEKLMARVEALENSNG